jgi:DNA modification methylase
MTGKIYFLYATNGGNNTFNVDSLHKGILDYGLTKQSEKKLGKHPNQKPIEMMSELVTILTNEGDTVLDICMGSGSTGVSCKKLNRDFIGIELDEEFYKLAVDRIKSTDVSKEVYHGDHIGER